MTNVGLASRTGDITIQTQPNFVIDSGMILSSALSVPLKPLQALKFTPAPAGMSMNGENQENFILTLRRQQVQTVEETYQFVSLKRPFSGEFLDSVAVSGGETEQTESGKCITASSSLHQSEPRWVIAFSITAYLIIGCVLAVLISPFSPLPNIARPLLIVVLPISVVGVIVQALVWQRRLNHLG